MVEIGKDRFEESLIFHLLLIHDTLEIQLSLLVEISLGSVARSTNFVS